MEGGLGGPMGAHTTAARAAARRGGGEREGAADAGVVKGVGGSIQLEQRRQDGGWHCSEAAGKSTDHQPAHVYGAKPIRG